jgi:hypothetical protein
MSDEPDPPRKFYGFKPREFERANPPRPASPNPDEPSAHSPAPDPGIVPVTDVRIDVHELARLAAPKGAILSSDGPANRPNEVHQILQANLARDQAAGFYHLEPEIDKKRRRRIRNYWIGLVTVDGIFGVIAWLTGPQAAIPFVSALAGLGMFTAWWTWETWFLRTD